MTGSLVLERTQSTAVHTTFRAAVMPAPGAPVEMKDFPMVTAGPGEVVMRTLYSEVCGTDVHIQDGKVDGVPYPVIPGHFSVGVAESVNGHVTSVDGRPIRPGDMISFLDVHRTCHKCRHCLITKTPTKCTKRKVYGVTHSSTEGPLGGWSERVLLEDDVLIAHLPKGLEPKRFIAGGCAMPTAIHAVERGGVGPGQLVVVQGAGPVGLCAAMAAFAAGAQVVVCDFAEVRLKVAAQLGFDCVNLSDEENAADAIHKHSGGHMADVVIEATGAPAAVPAGMSMVRDGGCYVIVGHYSDAGETAINPYRHINQKHLEVRGTWGIEYRHFHRALHLLATLTTPSGISDIETVLTKSFPLDRAQDALDAVRRRDVVKAIISLQ
ncbi:MAG: zinc-binding dehydrogenase [Pseudomonadota bacterium]